MPKFLKITLGVLGGLVALLLAAVAIVYATFDPNAYKPQMVEYVAKEYRRTLAIPGPLSLTLWPRLGVKVGALSLSERDSAERFASLESAQVSLALWPLFSREVVAERLTLGGLRARVVRSKDGKLSIDDLLAAGDKAAPVAPAAPAASSSPTPLKISIAGVAVTDAELIFDDRQAPRRLHASKLALQTGRIAQGVPVAWSAKARLEVDSPKLGSDVALQGKLLLGPAPGRLALEALEADIDTTLGALALKARLTGRIEGDTERQRYAAPAFAVALEGRQGTSPISAKLALPWAADLQAKTFEVAKLDLQASLPHPAGAQAKPLSLVATGSLAVEFGDKQQRLNAKLAGQFDESRFTASVGMPRLAPAATTFDVELDRFDADRYRAGTPAAAASAPAAPEKPLDLSALRALEASGQVRIGTLQAMNLKVTQLRADVRASGGRLTLAPLSAELYQGRLSGSAAITAATPARLTLQPTFSQVAVGPLLKDLTGNDRLLGRGNVALDVAASGATVGALTRSLAGSARLELRDGAVRGINLAQAIRSARALAKGDGAGTAGKDEATDFSELTASFRIAGGVAHNEDLAAKSPLVRVGGNGDIDLGAGRLDYTVKATVVATLQGQGGPELQALRGQTLPIKLSGPFTAIAWRIDFAGMAKEAIQTKVEAKIDEKREAIKEDAKRRLADKLRGVLKK